VRLVHAMTEEKELKGVANLAWRWQIHEPHFLEKWQVLGLR
jgi:hypothetical protein